MLLQKRGLPYGYLFHLTELIAVTKAIPSASMPNRMGSDNSNGFFFRQNKKQKQ